MYPLVYLHTASAEYCGVRGLLLLKEGSNVGGIVDELLFDPQSSPTLGPDDSHWRQKCPSVSFELVR
jgi:hypothetical protein